MLFDRRMQDNRLTGTLDVLQSLPLSDLYIHILFVDSQHIRIQFQLFDHLPVDLIRTWLLNRNILLVIVQTSEYDLI